MAPASWHLVGCWVSSVMVGAQTLALCQVHMHVCVRVHSCVRANRGSYPLGQGCLSDTGLISWDHLS